MKKLAGLLLGLSLGLVPLIGHTASSVSVSPNVVNSHPINTNPAISLTWTVISGGNEGLGGQNSSQGIFFNPSGAAMSPTTGAINIPQASCGASTACPVSEILLIPASIISQAQNNGYSFITYQRTFTGSMETAFASVTINLLYPTPTVTTTPSIFNVVVGSAAMINIAWQVTTFGNGSGDAFFDDGSFATAPNPNSNIPVGGTLTLAPLALLAAGTSTAFESLAIPQLVIDYAQQNNLDTLYYGRPYYNDNTGLSGERYVRINLITTNPNTVLTINRVALRFSDNTAVKIALPNTNITTLADISYFGSGLFDAMWEVAEPVSTPGQPIFVPLQPVRQFLVGGGMMSLQSPVLPTQKNGLHIVRLKICSPTLGAELGAAVGLCRVPAILQYMISPDGNTLALSALPPVRIQSPVNNALMTADTRFAWKPVKGAHGYQLELFLPEQSGLKPDDAAIAKRVPDSGMMVPAKTSSLTLAEMARNKLRPNTTYYWRIIAIGNKGQVVSSSELREIRIP